MSVRICQVCRAKIPEDSRFCPNCGKEIAIRVCQACGAQVPEGAGFCPNCGKEVVTTPLSPLKRRQRSKLRKGVTGGALVLGILLIALLISYLRSSVTPINQDKQVERTMVSVTLGPTKTEIGLRQLWKADEKATDADYRGGRPCLLMPNIYGMTTSYMYFNVENDFIYAKVTNVIVTVDYFDSGTGWLALEYDSSDFLLPQEGRFKMTPQVELRNNGNWYTATFYLPDAYFSDRQYGGLSDFRIASTSKQDVAIAQVTVSTAVSALQPTQQLTPTATTQPTQFVLQTSVNPSGSGAVNPGSGAYTAGTYLYVTATPAPGYWFVSWSGGGEGTKNPIGIRIDRDCTLQANFQPVPANNFRLQLVASPPGGCMFRPDSGVYPAGTTLEVLAIPSPGNRFLSWSGDVQNTSSRITITMNRDYTLQANFGPMPMPARGRLIISVSGTGIRVPIRWSRHYAKD